jgi:hypothetical protein
MAYGYRAMFVIINTYMNKYGLNTIAKIVGRWAPPNENNTTLYIQQVAQWSGIDANFVLTPSDGDTIAKIVAAMSQKENGYPAVMSDVLAGLSLQKSISVKKK